MMLVLLPIQFYKGAFPHLHTGTPFLSLSLRRRQNQRRLLGGLSPMIILRMR
jgi:hypothetical protein